MIGLEEILRTHGYSVVIALAGDGYEISLYNYP